MNSLDVKLFILLALLLASVSTVLAANDPGHDTLYVLRLGDTNVTGSINLTGNVTARLVRISDKVFGSYIEVVGNGTTDLGTFGTASRIISGNNELYIDSPQHLYINTKGGTSSVVQVGPMTGNLITLNVSGNITQRGVKVCLADGTNCPGGSNTGNVSSIIAGNGISVNQATGAVTVSTSATTCIAGNYSYWDGNSWECTVDQSSTVTGTGNAGNISYWTDANTLSSSTLYQSGGNIGIGTASPTYRLGVTGNVSITGVNANSGHYLLKVTGGTSTSTAGQNIEMTAGTGGTVNANGAGRGGNITITGGTGGFYDTGASFTAQSGGHVIIAGGDEPAGADDYTAISGGSVYIKGGRAYSSTGSAHVYIAGGRGVNGGANGSAILAWDASGPIGNVGIGTTTPNQKLQVNGSVNVSGTSVKLYTPEICLAGSCQTSWPGNSSWNQTHASTLYYGISNPWGYYNSSTLPASSTPYQSSAAGWTNTSPTLIASAADANITVDTDVLKVDATNNKVGIGTISPTYKLQVVSSSSTDGAIIDAATSPEIQLRKSNSVKAYIATTGTGGVYAIGTSVDSFILRSENAMHLIANAGTLIMTLNNSRVGIGTTTPYATLQVAGTINTTGNIYENDVRVCTATNGLCASGGGNQAAGWTNTSTTIYTTDTNDNVSIGAATAPAKLYVNAEYGSGNSTGLNILYNETGGADQLSALHTGLRVRAESNAQVSREGSMDFTGADIDVIFNSSIDEGATTESIILTGLSTTVNAATTSTDGSDTFFIYGNTISVVGDIGTSMNDGEKVGVFSSVTGTAFVNTAGSFSASGASSNTGMTASAIGGTTAVGGKFSAGSGTNNYGIEITSLNAGANNYAIYSGAAAKSYFAGSVGIGDTVPTQKLSVVGNINISGPGNIYYQGNLTGYGADLAENVFGEGVEAGDVVILHPERDKAVMKTSVRYDTRVAGIISTDPSHLMSADEGDVPLALAGRVPVKVTAENGAIRRGDLLTTSSTPGYAMRCADRQSCAGSIVGKAMESLDTDSGMITALVALG